MRELRRAAFLAPLSVLYGAVTSFRNYLYDQRVLASYRAGVPVICVGNATVGGNGKSPLVAALAILLQEHFGRMPVILSRGYGGSVKGPHLVDVGSDVSSVVGDEPLMLARKLTCPVVVSRCRVAGAKFIELRRLGDVILLDDGYQHRALARDLNLLCAAARTQEELARTLEGSLLPQGLLREPVEQALSRADALVLQARAHSEPVSPSSESLARLPRLASIPMVRTRFWPFEFIEYATGKAVGAPASAHLVTAIANPEAVVEVLVVLGVKMLSHRVLPDHSPDLERIVATFGDSREPIIITEKDAAKLSDSQASKQRVLVLRPQLEVIDSAELESLVEAALKR